ncbi:uncharacterized protein EDB93DRAFT_1107356 [Suillus bovinus]|uniref:uncharacterized protein n=1 Tax=Suillus bovinus TaxID=48563 RepID=UPI001B86832F|nr:uncharacterized protein EDB93DRAFT_1107356 [Suillus bovinus]KAG2134151.1 hypothetical protein EDB93DRAFT_1107356 [Suillus bovinus]
MMEPSQQECIRELATVEECIPPHNTVTGSHLGWAAKGDNVPRQTGHPTGPIAEIVPIYTGGPSVGWAECSVPDGKGWAECSVYWMERDGLNIVNGVYNGDEWAEGFLGTIEMDGPKYSGLEKEVPTRSGHRIPGSEIPAGIYQPTGSGNEWSCSTRSWDATSVIPAEIKGTDLIQS